MSFNNNTGGAALKAELNSVLSFSENSTVNLAENKGGR